MLRPPHGAAGHAAGRGPPDRGVGRPCGGHGPAVPGRDWPATWSNRAGRDRTPTVPGHEVSGVVTELGYGTAGLTVGQRVFGLTDWSARCFLSAMCRRLSCRPATSPSHCVRWASPRRWRVLVSISSSGVPGPGRGGAWGT
ncbi:alcohol dehydrogenase catalytic domain-containing protein [Streptomyces sp. NPDC059837]|uniref:alcohol dehydrogenase catalytic domain-containing protein n=1 Tax=Streptomyces sp. NPDC059837 TaxID=3346968 RepID=UPI00366658B1